MDHIEIVGVEISSGVNQAAIQLIRRGGIQSRVIDDTFGRFMVREHYDVLTAADQRGLQPLAGPNEAGNFEFRGAVLSLGFGRH